MIHITYLQKK